MCRFRCRIAAHRANLTVASAPTLDFDPDAPSHEPRERQDHISPQRNKIETSKRPPARLQHRHDRHTAELRQQ